MEQRLQRLHMVTNRVFKSCLEKLQTNEQLQQKAGDLGKWDVSAFQCCSILAVKMFGFQQKMCWKNDLSIKIIIILKETNHEETHTLYTLEKTSIMFLKFAFAYFHLIQRKWEREFNSSLVHCKNICKTWLDQSKLWSLYQC